MGAVSEWLTGALGYESLSDLPWRLLLIGGAIDAALAAGVWVRGRKKARTNTRD